MRKNILILMAVFSISSAIAQKKSQLFTEVVNGVSFRMVAIPAGTFQMGSDGGGETKPAYKVTIREFYMGETEVTQALWKAVMGENRVFNKGVNNPVDLLDWKTIQKFITKLNELTGKKYRLPSESEWEYACRAGSNTTYYTGNKINLNQANFRAKYGEYGNKRSYNRSTVAVKSFAPNAFGLYEMHGNVAEWCQDTYVGSYKGAFSNGSARVLENSRERVIRGGSYASPSSRISSRYRGHEDVTMGSSGYGFRLAINKKEEETNETDE